MEKLPYNRAFACFLKFNWAVGKRITRIILLNRKAPPVGGVVRDILTWKKGTGCRSWIFSPATVERIGEGPDKA